MPKKVCVIGAGPAGLTAAYLLQKGGVDVVLCEASSKVGGMCQSFDLWGQRVDMGPHRFFSNDRRINEFWLSVIGDDYEMVDRQTRIYYNKSFFSYPLKGFEAILKLGLVQGFMCGLSYLKTRVFPAEDKGDFESWVVSRFGYRLYSIFFKTYSEKLWGIPCTELDSDFASQRIKKFSLFAALKSAFGIGTSKHKTLVNEFAFPKMGTGMVYEKMADAFVAAGGELKLSSPIKEVEKGDSKTVSAVITGAGERIECERVVSSMPLTRFVSALSEETDPIRDVLVKLKYRNTILVYSEVSRDDLFDDQWLYIHSSEVELGRITNFRNWVPGILGDSKNTILCSELWCNDDDVLWEMSDESLGKLVTKDLAVIGLATGSEILNTKVLRVPKSYPVYEKGYRDHVEKVREFLSGFSNVDVIGRYGSFKYNNQDHSILMGQYLSENILKDAGHDLWAVNTDYEGYQEATVITKTGLKSKD